MKKYLFGLLGLLVFAGQAMAQDVAFEVAAPTFDWTELGVVAVSMVTVAAAMAVYRRLKGIIR